MLCIIAISMLAIYGVYIFKVYSSDITIYIVAIAAKSILYILTLTERQKNRGRI